jgi:Adaptin N terminal region
METSRRSELSDLETQLKAFAGKGSGAGETALARRELFRKLVSLQTLGVDVSPLFGTVLMNAATADVPTKKMLYHYVTAVAKTKPDLALLTVNMLVKDASDADPTIRTLALRSLASLRVPSLAEYVADALRKGLADSHPGPRKTAALGVLKLHDVGGACGAVGDAAAADDGGGQLWGRGCQLRRGSARAGRRRCAGGQQAPRV